MHEYAQIGLNDFSFTCPIAIPCLHECVVTYFSKVYAFKEDGAVFLKQQNVTFLVAGSIWFFFVLD